MKKLITTASLTALGLVSLQAANSTGLTETEQSKVWSVSASLRGFYDDNYATVASRRLMGFDNNGNQIVAKAQDSFGIDVSPSVSLNFPLERTLISASYIYSMRWYEAREKNSADHSHQVDAKLDHKFTENYKMAIRESFAVAQEQELLNDGPIAVPIRLNGNNIRNSAAITFTGDFARNLGADIGYGNSWYDYENDNTQMQREFGTPFGSYSALLDRFEHLAHVNLRWRVLPQTVALVGYQFGYTEHLAKAETGIGPSQVRDSYSHYFYLGADQNFTSTLNGAVRVGAQYTEYPNADLYNPQMAGWPANISDSSWSPYADANVTYTYAPGSFAQLGIKHTRVQTDVLAMDQEATTIYGSVSHRITPKLIGSLLAQFQDASFNQGLYNDQAEQYYVLGLNLAYQFNKFLAAEAGYNYDRLDSDIVSRPAAGWTLPRSFTRNRVYLGVRASY